MKGFWAVKDLFVLSILGIVLFVGLIFVDKDSRVRHNVKTPLGRSIIGWTYQTSPTPSHRWYDDYIGKGKP